MNSIVNWSNIIQVIEERGAEVKKDDNGKILGIVRKEHTKEDPIDLSYTIFNEQLTKIFFKRGEFELLYEENEDSYIFEMKIDRHFNTAIKDN